MIPFRFSISLAITLSFVGGSFAQKHADSRALYSPTEIFGFFTLEMKAALKITPEQDAQLTATEFKRAAIWKEHLANDAKLRATKLPERELTVKRRAMETQVVAQLFASLGETLRADQLNRMKQIILQVRGMELFDYPEIREVLKIGDQETKVLNAAYAKLMQGLSEDVKAKRLTQREASIKSQDMSFSVPEQVRESLTKEQKRILESLLGEKYVYKK